MKSILLPLFLIASFSFSFGQSRHSIVNQFDWSEDPIIHNPFELNDPLEILSFDGAIYQDVHPSLPISAHRFQVNSKGNLSVEIINVEYQPLDKKPTQDDAFIQDQLVFQTEITQNRQQYFGNVSFIPIIKSASGGFQKVVSIELNVYFTPSTPTLAFRGPPTYTSKLADGDIYKIKVDKDGMYKLTYDFLKTQLGIDNLDNLDPKKIQVLGNGGGMLPELNDTERIDDLEENAVFVKGENDGSFDSDDYILFYGEGPGKWSFNTTTNAFFYQKNIYTDAKFYFIKIGSDNGKRVENQASVTGTTYTTTSSDAFTHFEDDQRNLLHDWSGAQGSGKLFVGDLFSLVTERSYNNLFSFNNLEAGEDAILTGSFASRSSSTTNFKVTTAGQEFTSSNIGNVSLDNGETTFAKTGSFLETFQPNNGNFSFVVRYSGTGESEGWLDFLGLNVRQKLQMSGSQLKFTDKKTLDYPASTFQLSDAEGVTIWDVTNPLNPFSQEASEGSLKFFGAETTNLKRFIAFNGSDNLFPAEAIGKVENQNLHGLDNIDMIIVYHKNFEEVAEKIREHRATQSNLMVEKTRLDQIYNEFSGGAQDICAIRDFSKMLHDRSDQFKYLLLFGDGSFDYRNIKGLNTSTDGDVFHNLIPVYETDRSLHPISSYPSDDFFGLLSSGEGTSTLAGDLDIAVGRLPFKNEEEAQGVVNKIINYDTNPATLGDWRNRLTFVGDDEDGSIHTKQADQVSQLSKGEHNVFNHDKIFFDAYQQVSTSGGQRFPSATEAINQSMFKGNLVMNYLGHGGGGGWAQERVLRTQHIVDWENFDKLPLLVTATCSFTGYDEPNYVTAGEHSMINEKGGVIGLFTTVRAVYSSQNKVLTDAVFKNIFDRVDGQTFTIGEVARLAKNDIGLSSQNKRKFALIGDPAQKLAIPEYNIVTTKINGSVIDSTSQDTIQALQKVTIEGQIEDFDGTLLSDFNGKVFPTIFDKPITISTLGQDSGSPIFEFKLQKNVIFKGVASVSNGTFTFTFVVPKDINYSYDYGKISYYAHDGVDTDASGYYDKMIIGGTDPNAIADDQPPLIEVYMNNEEFVFGGITDENPILLAKLSDDNGINVVGNSIGHDLTGVLDQNTQNTYVLNDFYESELDDYTKGTVRYPLFNLEEGLHKIRVRAWDVSNNSAEGYTEFVVASSAEVALEHVLNYPNPFMDNTSFQFEHNLPNQIVDVQIRVFSVSGRLVKTIDEQIMTEGTRVTGIQWNGTDEYGDQLARGIYLYKVKIGGTGSAGDAINTESDFEKLVILK
jgi:hypothetical protein